MTESATPETGTEPVSPEPGPISDEQALAILDKKLEPQGDQATEEAPPESTPIEESQAQPEEEEAKADESEEKPESEDVSEETEEAEAELPSTFEELAEALDLAPDEFAANLKTKVKVNGEEMEVTLAEALKGYSREADYTQGTQRLAEERKQVENERNTVLTQWQQNVENLESMATALANHVSPQNDQQLIAKYTRVDEDGYQQFDQAGYFAEKAQQDEIQQTVYGALQEAQQHRQQMAEYQQQQIAEFRQEQQRLASQAIPALREPEGTRKFEDGMNSLLTSVGFTEEEVKGFMNGAWDHRYLKVIEKAMGQSNLEKSKKTTLKKLTAKPKVQKPGAPVETKERDDRVAEARKRLKRAQTRAGKDSAALELIDAKLG